MKKPVFDADPQTMWDYEYQAKHYRHDGVEIIASDSLANLKKEVKERGWRHAWITTADGCFSYNQQIVDEYPYIPRY